MKKAIALLIIAIFLPQQLCLAGIISDLKSGRLPSPSSIESAAKYYVSSARTTYTAASNVYNTVKSATGLSLGSLTSPLSNINIQGIKSTAGIATAVLTRNPQAGIAVANTNWTKTISNELPRIKNTISDKAIWARDQTIFKPGFWDTAEGREHKQFLTSYFIFITGPAGAAEGLVSSVGGVLTAGVARYVPSLAIRSAPYVDDAIGVGSKSSLRSTVTNAIGAPLRDLRALTQGGNFLAKNYGLRQAPQFVVTEIIPRVGFYGLAPGFIHTELMSDSKKQAYMNIGQKYSELRLAPDKATKDRLSLEMENQFSSASLTTADYILSPFDTMYSNAKGMALNTFGSIDSVQRNDKYIKGTENIQGAFFNSWIQTGFGLANEYGVVGKAIGYPLAASGYGAQTITGFGGFGWDIGYKSSKYGRKGWEDNNGLMAGPAVVGGVFQGAGMGVWGMAGWLTSLPEAGVYGVLSKVHNTDIQSFADKYFYQGAIKDGAIMLVDSLGNGLGQEGLGNRWLSLVDPEGDNYKIVVDRSRGQDHTHEGLTYFFVNALIGGNPLRSMKRVEEATGIKSGVKTSEASWGIDAPVINLYRGFTSKMLLPMHILMRPVASVRYLNGLRGRMSDQLHFSLPNLYSLYPALSTLFVLPGKTFRGNENDQVGAPDTGILNKDFHLRNAASTAGGEKKEISALKVKTTKIKEQVNDVKDYLDSDIGDIADFKNLDLTPAQLVSTETFLKQESGLENVAVKPFLNEAGGIFEGWKQANNPEWTLGKHHLTEMEKLLYGNLVKFVQYAMGSGKTEVKLPLGALIAHLKGKISLTELPSEPKAKAYWDYAQGLFKQSGMNIVLLTKDMVTSSETLSAMKEQFNNADGFVFSKEAADFFKNLSDRDSMVKEQYDIFTGQKLGSRKIAMVRDEVHEKDNAAIMGEDFKPLHNRFPEIEKIRQKVGEAIFKKLSLTSKDLQPTLETPAGKTVAKEEIRGFARFSIQTKQEIAKALGHKDVYGLSTGEVKMIDAIAETLDKMEGTDFTKGTEPGKEQEGDKIILMHKGGENPGTTPQDPYTAAAIQTVLQYVYGMKIDKNNVYSTPKGSQTTHTAFLNDLMKSGAEILNISGTVKSAEFKLKSGFKAAGEVPAEDILRFLKSKTIEERIAREKGISVEELGDILAKKGISSTESIKDGEIKIITDIKSCLANLNPVKVNTVVVDQGTYPHTWLINEVIEASRQKGIKNVYVQKGDIWVHKEEGVTQDKVLNSVEIQKVTEETPEGESAVLIYDVGGRYGTNVPGRKGPAGENGNMRQTSVLNSRSRMEDVFQVLARLRNKNEREIFILATKEEKINKFAGKDSLSADEAFDLFVKNEVIEGRWDNWDTLNEFISQAVVNCISAIHEAEKAVAQPGEVEATGRLKEEWQESERMATIEVGKLQDTDAALLIKFNHAQNFINNAAARLLGVVKSAEARKLIIEAMTDKPFDKINYKPEKEEVADSGVFAMAGAKHPKQLYELIAKYVLRGDLPEWIYPGAATLSWQQIGTVKDLQASVKGLSLGKEMEPFVNALSRLGLIQSKKKIKGSLDGAEFTIFGKQILRAAKFLQSSTMVANANPLAPVVLAMRIYQGRDEAPESLKQRIDGLVLQPDDIGDMTKEKDLEKYYAVIGISQTHIANLISAFKNQGFIENEILTPKGKAFLLEISKVSGFSAINFRLNLLDDLIKEKDILAASDDAIKSWLKSENFKSDELNKLFNSGYGKELILKLVNETRGNPELLNAWLAQLINTDMADLKTDFTVERAKIDFYKQAKQAGLDEKKIEKAIGIIDQRLVTQPAISKFAEQLQGFKQFDKTVPELIAELIIEDIKLGRLDNLKNKLHYSFSKEAITRLANRHGLEVKVRKEILALNLVEESKSAVTEVEDFLAQPSNKSYPASSNFKVIAEAILNTNSPERIYEVVSSIKKILRELPSTPSTAPAPTSSAVTDPEVVEAAEINL